MMLNSPVQLFTLLQLNQQPAGDAITQVAGLTHLEGIKPGACKSFASVLLLKLIIVYI